MKTSNKVEYRLPLTNVRLESTITVTTDKYGPGSTKAIANATLSTVADPEVSHTLTVTSSSINDLALSLSLSDDQRLTSAASESTGQLGAAISKLLGVASTIVGAVIAPGALAPEDTADTEYQKDYPDLAQRRQDYGTLNKEISLKLLALNQQLVAATATTRVDTSTSSDAKANVTELFAALRRLRLLRSYAEDEIAQLNNHYDLWRDAARSVRVEKHRANFGTSYLPQMNKDGEFLPEELDESSALWAAWINTGAMVTIDEVEQEPKPANGKPVATPAKVESTKTPERKAIEGDGIWIRIPRQVIWRLWQREIKFDGQDTKEKAVLVDSGLTTVVDSKCTLQFIKFRRSLWARRATKVEFSESGALKTFEVAATSSAAAATGALGDIRTAIESGLESAGKIASSWQSIQDNKADHELARLKAQVELKENELKAAGLLATQERYAELEALKQQVQLADAKLALDPLASVTQQLQRQTKHVDALRENAVAKRQLQAESELTELRLEIERLKAHWQMENIGAKTSDG